MLEAVDEAGEPLSMPEAEITYALRDRLAAPSTEGRLAHGTGSNGGGCGCFVGRRRGRRSHRRLLGLRIASDAEEPANKLRLGPKLNVGRGGKLSRRLRIAAARDDECTFRLVHAPCRIGLLNRLDADVLSPALRLHDRPRFALRHDQIS